VKKKSSNASFVSDELRLCPRGPGSSLWLLLCLPFLLPFLLSGTVQCDEATKAAACGGWEGLQFSSGLYSPSSLVASER
jgi:hypothetical protein